MPLSGNNKPGEFGLSWQDDNKDLVLLGAFCLFLSAIDHLIPKPLPFMRIGLANLPLLIALDIFSAKNFFLLSLIKVLGQALITGTLFSYVALFSLAGTALSSTVMFLLRGSFRKNLPKQTYHISLIGTGIAGAFVSNAAQLLLARYIIFGEGARYLAPPFLAAGIISGGLLGFFAEAFSVQSQWLRIKREKAPLRLNKSETDDVTAGIPVEVPADNRGPAFSFRSIVLLLSAAFFLFVPSLHVRTVLFLFFWLLALGAGRKTRPLFTVVSIMMITACNLFPPFGKILFRTGPLIIAEGSLLRGLQRAVTMEGLIMFSRVALLSVPTLPGKLGRLVQDSLCMLEKINNVLDNSFPGIQKRFLSGKLLENLDRLLCELSGFN